MRRKVRKPSTPVELYPKKSTEPKEPHSIGVDDDLLNDLADIFSVLYDPNNFYHLPLEEQVKKFAHNNLYDTKYYKEAMKFFGDRRTVRELLGPTKGRRRVIIADSSTYFPPKVQHQSDGAGGFGGVSAGGMSTDPFYTPPPRAPPNAPSEEEEEARSAYKTKLSQLKGLRSGLEKLGDLDLWLAGKPDKSEAEKRMKQRLWDEKHPQEMKAPEVLPSLVPKKVHLGPQLSRPSPFAMKLIARELQKHRLRLLDIFTEMDKDKSWTLTREEFRNAFKRHRIHLPVDVLEDLIITLDADNNNQLDYRELAHGLEQYRLQERRRKSSGWPEDIEESPEKNASRASSARSTASSTTSSTLSVAPVDRTVEHYAFQSEEEALDIRKQIKAAEENLPKEPGTWPNKRMPPIKKSIVPESLVAARREQRRSSGRVGSGRSRGTSSSSSSATTRTFRTGHPPYDAHCAPSTLTGSAGEAMNAFRAKSFRVYMDLLSSCEARGIPLNEVLLEHVLLYPGDVKHEECKEKLPSPDLHKGSSGLMSRAEAHSQLQSLLAKQANGGSAHAAYLLTQFNSRYSSGLLPGEEQRGTPFYVAAAAAAANGTGGPGANSLEGTGDDLLNSSGRPRFVNLYQVGRKLPRLSELKDMHEEWDEPVQLSTGPAKIQPQVDCWMSFEEFLKFTKNVKRKFPQNFAPTKRNAFWPGELANRVRLYLENEPPFHQHLTSMMHRVRL